MILKYIIQQILYNKSQLLIAKIDRENKIMNSASVEPVYIVTFINCGLYREVVHSLYR